MLVLLFIALVAFGIAIDARRNRRDRAKGQHPVPTQQTAQVVPGSSEEAVVALRDTADRSAGSWRRLNWLAKIGIVVGTLVVGVFVFNTLEHSQRPSTPSTPTSSTQLGATTSWQAVCREVICWTNDTRTIGCFHIEGARRFVELMASPYLTQDERIATLQNDLRGECFRVEAGNIVRQLGPGEPAPGGPPGGQIIPVRPVAGPGDLLQSPIKLDFYVWTPSLELAKAGVSGRSWWRPVEP